MVHLLNILLLMLLLLRDMLDLWIIPHRSSRRSLVFDLVDNCEQALVKVLRVRQVRMH